MRKRIISICSALIFLFAMLPTTSIQASAVETGETNTINALNALLIGVRFYPEYYGSDVAKWTDEAICDVIYGKLLWDNYSYSELSYLNTIGLEYWSSEDWYWHFDLELIQRITQDTLV